MIADAESTAPDATVDARRHALLPVRQDVSFVSQRNRSVSPSCRRTS